MTRSQAERDAVTVEIMYAVATAVGIAAVVVLAVASPILIWGLDGATRSAFLYTGMALGAAVFVVQVLRVLRRR